MKVLWLCNTILPEIAEQLCLPIAASGGWLTGAAKKMKESESVQLSICFPQNKTADLISGKVNGVRYWGYPLPKKGAHIYDMRTERVLEQVIQEATPDLVHIWGTEYPHALAMTRVFDSQRTIISIQGLCGYIANHYLGFLPKRLYSVCSLRDCLRRDRTVDQQKKFSLRGRFEEEALKNVSHIIGRTRWDYACTRQLAPETKYHFCNETLRDVFYEKAGMWRPDTCESHSIFVSQANYPVKGFHIALQAMPEILRNYPDARLYTTGKSPFKQPIYRLRGYQKVLRKEIKRLNLMDKVVFLGQLNDVEMCDRFLRSNVFVSASSIENSPNSVCEAMMLGVPIVASFVGGTMDLLCDQKEGFLYQTDASYMLAHYICSIFADEGMAFHMGQSASAHARITHNREHNLQVLLNIYKEVLKI